MSRDLSPSAAELALLASELPAADVRRLTRLLVLIKAASRPAQEQASAMLRAAPEPADADEVNARWTTVINYLERRAHEQ